MKTRGILFSVLLLVSYHMLTLYWQKTSLKITLGQGKRSYNTIKTQEFLYDEKTKYNCLLGTSLSVGIPQENLPNNFYNLALGGQTVLDGLKILMLKKQLPDTIYVEINYITKDNNPKFINGFAQNKIEITVKKYLPMLQEKYVPVGILANYFATLNYKIDLGMPQTNNRYFFYWNYFIGIIKNKFFADSPATNLSNKGNNKTTVFRKLLEMEKTRHTVIPNKENLELTFQEVQTYIRSLEKKSVVFAFYETPVNCELNGLALSRFNREIVEKNFPFYRYKYIMDANCSDYSTRDGTHLEYQDAKKFGDYLSEQMKKLQNKR